MADINVFDQDAFSTFELTTALDLIPYQPSFLGNLGIFEPVSLTGITAAVEKRETELALVPTSPRGAPVEQSTKDARDIRDFRTVRVAKGDTLNASEIQSIRAFGTMTELEAVVAETTRRLVKVRRDIELTLEHMRLGAIQGIVLDADGQTVIRDWYTEFGIQQPQEIDFDLDNPSPQSGAVRKKCNEVIRKMQRAAKGAWTPNTQVIGLSGDNFYDDLTAHKEVRETYLNNPSAEALREQVGRAFDMFRYGGIIWVNYRGTDDNSTVAVHTDKAHFFPLNAPGVFQHAMSPGETFDWANTPGQMFYSMLVRDVERNMWVKPEVYSYPLFICTRPEMLQRAKRT